MSEPEQTTNDDINDDIVKGMGGEPITLVTIHRWPVLGREQTATGKLKCSASSYRRTANPVATRTERVLLVTANRAHVSWGYESGVELDREEFLLGSGRMVGNADWMLSKESKKMLRKMSRAIYDIPVQEDENDGDPEGSSLADLAREAAASDSSQTEGG